MEKAVELADEYNAKFEDPHYCDVVAAFITCGDLEGLRDIMRTITNKLDETNHRGWEINIW